MKRRPVAWAIVAVFLGAVAIRLAAAVLAPPGADGYLIEDEAKYVDLAHAVTEGDDLGAIDHGYGASLYESRRAFLAPLAVAFHLTGPSRLTGQILAAVFGAATAAATFALTMRVARPAAAWFAAAIVVLLPSQVLWSSVVLPESMVWACLAAVGLAFGFTVDPTRTARLRAFGVAAIGILALSALRDYTAVVALWAVVAAATLVSWRSPALRHRWGTRRGFGLAVIALLLIGPAALGAGVGGVRFVADRLESLTTSRTYLAIEAATPIGTVERLPELDGSIRATSPAGTVIYAPDRRAFLVRDGIEPTLRHLPRGLAGVTVRPVPWDDLDGGIMLLGGVEGPVWWMLYALAAIGAGVAWREPRWLAFPFLVIVGFLVIGSVTEGDVNTAFRHRGQVLWALATMGAVGADRLASVRRRSSP